MIELKNSKIQYLGQTSGRERYAVDAFIGAVQMRDLGEPWQDIKPRLVRDADGWHIEGAPYYAEIKDDGARLFCPEKSERHNYLRLPAPALFRGLARNIVSNTARLDGAILPNQITMPTEWGEIRIIFSNTGMHFEILFTKAPPSALFGKDSPKILLDVETARIDIAQLLKSREGLGIPPPRLMPTNLSGNEPQEHWLDWSYKNGQMELGFDFADLSFPILLKNTTIDVQVGASADDGNVRGTSSFNATGDLRVGYWASGPNDYYHAWSRFAGITIPQSSTINVAYLTVYDSGTLGSPLTKIYADDQNNPSAISSNSDYYSRTLTTAGVDEDGAPGSGWHNTGSIVSVIQELVNSYDYSNKAIQIMWKNDGSTGDNLRESLTWDYGDHSYAPKLHIEYSAGGATAKTSAETGAGAEGRLLQATMSRGETSGGTDNRQSLLASLIRNESGSGAEDRLLQAAMSRGETSGGMDNRQSLLASLIRNESGNGIEQSLLTSFVAKLSMETGSGLETHSLVARLITSEVGYGVDTGAILGLKNNFGSDIGVGYDALKALIGTSGAVSDMKLPGRQGRVKMPSKGVSL